MINEIDDYFAKGCGRCAKFDTSQCATRLWADSLSCLRRICRDAGLEETVKWGHPCYMHSGRNVVLIGAFRDDIRLTFFNAALLTDPEGILQRRGPNTRHPDAIHMTDIASVARLEPTLRAYLSEAIGYAVAGTRPEKQARTLELPDELVAALEADPALGEAFDALTPGRQRSYVINLTGAKTSATRIRRIQKFRDKILSGKGALDR